MPEKWKKCNKCGFTSPDLKWDKELYAKEGFWKLAIITNAGGVETKIQHVCKEGSGTTYEKPLDNYGPLIECQYCGHTSYGWFNRKEDLDNHIKTYHPNGEILYEEDYSLTKPTDEDYVQRPCTQCTQEKGYTVLHPYKYKDVKSKSIFVCIR